MFVKVILNDIIMKNKFNKLKFEGFKKLNVNF